MEPESHIGNFDGTATALVPVPAFGPTPGDALGSYIPDVIARVPATPQRAPLTRSNALSARVWHNRYIAWQNRDRKQREEKAKLEAERMRIFGATICGVGIDDAGNDGCTNDEEDGLEEKMLEYFSGLEWLDT